MKTVKCICGKMALINKEEQLGALNLHGVLLSTQHIHRYSCRKGRQHGFPILTRTGL